MNATPHTTHSTAVRRVVRPIVTLLLLAAAVVATVASIAPAQAGPQLRGVDGLHGPVVGKNFSPVDRPYVINNFAGIRYTFGIPRSWSCGAGSSVFHTTGVATCWDEKGMDGQRAGGAVGYQQCRTTCNNVDVDRVGMQLRMNRGSWRVLDATTWYAEEHGKMDGLPTVRVALRHTFTPRGSRIANGIAYAQLTGPTQDRDEMLKILNSIRVNTPR